MFPHERINAIQYTVGAAPGSLVGILETRLAAQEQVCLIPGRTAGSIHSRLAFAVRRFGDLQLATIWKFLQPKLKLLERNVLDVGCGDMPYRSSVPPEVEYVGIDVPQATAFAMRRSNQIVRADGTSIPFPDGSFRTVPCTEVLEHVVDPMKLIARMHRVLEPNGELLATVPFSARVHFKPFDFHRFTMSRFPEMFSAFDHVEVAERGSDIAVIAKKLILLAIGLCGLPFRSVPIPSIFPSRSLSRVLLTQRFA